MSLISNEGGILRIKSLLDTEEIEKEYRCIVERYADTEEKKKLLEIIGNSISYINLPDPRNPPRNWTKEELKMMYEEDEKWIDGWKKAFGEKSF